MDGIICGQWKKKKQGQEGQQPGWAGCPHHLLSSGISGFFKRILVVVSSACKVLLNSLVFNEICKRFNLDWFKLGEKLLGRSETKQWE